MILNEEQMKQFQELCRPIIEFLNNNCHPHVHVTIDCGRAELSEGVCAFVTEDYIKD